MRTVSRASRKRKVDPHELYIAKAIVKKETQLVKCPACNYFEIPKNHADAGIHCLSCITNENRRLHK